MPEYAYEALTEQGAVENGQLEAASEDELENLLRARGQFLIRASESIPEEPPDPELEKQERREKLDRKIPRSDMLAFTEYLMGSAQAGIAILTTLEDIEAQVESKAMSQIIAEIRESMLNEGKSLSEAMAMFPKAFSGLYIGTIQAGESTGQLDYVMEQLVDYLEWQQEIGIQVRQATLYPAIVFSLMAALVVLLVVFVYPRLTPVFEGYDVELPVPTLIILGIGDLFRTQWPLMVLLLGMIAVGYAMINRTPPGRYFFDSVKLRIPIFGKLFHELEMARIVTYMALFYRTGIDLLRGLELLEGIIKNKRVERAVRQARKAISGGESVATAMSATGLFPLIVVRSFAMGEATGQLDQSLERARVYYAREVPAAVKRMLGALQPMLIIVMGGLIAMVALSIFLPVLQIYQNLSP